MPSGEEVQLFAPANALPARSEAAAVQPVIGISQRVRVNSKEKKDLGTLGMIVPTPPVPIIKKYFLIVWGEANGTLCPLLGRLCAGHYHDGDHHCHRSWHRLGLYLQEVSSFSCGLSERRGRR